MPLNLNFKNNVIKLTLTFHKVTVKIYNLTL